MTLYGNPFSFSFIVFRCFVSLLFSNNLVCRILTSLLLYIAIFFLAPQPCVPSPRSPVLPPLAVPKPAQLEPVEPAKNAAESPENHGQRRNAKSHATGGADGAGGAPLAWLLRKVGQQKSQHLLGEIASPSQQLL